MNMNHVTPTHEESFRKKWENYIPQELHQTFNLMLDVVINEARDGMKSPDVQPQTELNSIAEVIERGEEVWIKVFSNWSKGTYIGYDTTKNVHLVREDKEGGGNLLSSDKISKIKPINEQPAKQFDRDRFEAMYRAIVASGRYDIKTAEQALEKLDAYYASKEGGNNG